MSTYYQPDPSLIRINPVFTAIEMPGMPDYSNISDNNSLAPDSNGPLFTSTLYISPAQSPTKRAASGKSLPSQAKKRIHIPAQIPPELMPTPGGWACNDCGIGERGTSIKRKGPDGKKVRMSDSRAFVTHVTSNGAREQKDQKEVRQGLRFLNGKLSPRSHRGDKTLETIISDFQISCQSHIRSNSLSPQK